MKIPNTKLKILARRYFRKELDTVMRMHSEELAKIRQQERNRYEPIIYERDNEILRLNQEIYNRRKEFKIINDHGENVITITKEISEKMIRGRDLITKGIAMFESAMNIAEQGEREIRKKTIKMLEK